VGVDQHRGDRHPPPVLPPRAARLQAPVAQHRWPGGPRDPRRGLHLWPSSPPPLRLFSVACTMQSVYDSSGSVSIGEVTELRFGNPVRELRKAKSWSLRSPPAKVGVAFTHLSRVRNERLRRLSQRPVDLQVGEGPGRGCRRASLRKKSPDDISDSLVPRGYSDVYSDVAAGRLRAVQPKRH
jgi:hypothetical protein